MKKILIIAAVLALAIGLMVPATGWALYDYNSTGKTKITLTIPEIKVLDLAASDQEITWVEITAADLQKGYVVRRSATNLIVDSNDSVWDVAVTVEGTDGAISGSDYYFFTSGGATSDLAVTSLSWRSFNVSGSPTVQDSWQTFAGAGTCTNKVMEKASGGTGENYEALVDYKIDTDWSTTTGSGLYITLTYTLS